MGPVTASENASQARTEGSLDRPASLGEIPRSEPDGRCLRASG
jgi:hypothetical protein